MATIPPAAESKHRRLLLEIGKAVDAYLKAEKAGQAFVLMLFDPAKPETGGNYLSSAPRDAVRIAMRARLELFDGA